MQEDELAEHALWCRRFASVNATGLRKIAKKHDKYAHNDAGKQFVRVRFQEVLLTCCLVTRACKAHIANYNLAVYCYWDPTHAKLC